MNSKPQNHNEIDQAKIDREIEELLGDKKDSKPHLGPAIDPSLPQPDKLTTSNAQTSKYSDNADFVIVPPKKKSVLKPFLLGVILLVMLGFGAVKGFQALHIGQTECCDGTWSDSKGSGTCSHHGGIIGVGCRQCQDGTWSTAKGGGACSRHGGLKDKK